MSFDYRQGQFFYNEINQSKSIRKIDRLELTREVIEKWQKRIYLHQSKVIAGHTKLQQGEFFPSEKGINKKDEVNPLNLTPLPMSFWRWPNSPHHGPAIYLVMDQIEITNDNLILYIGETIAANRRWKGEHDCKNYLAAYSESLSNAGLKASLSIRFWTDVPKHTKARRKLEQMLIEKWLPPFNKETRGIWSTPFTSEEF